MTSTPTLRRKKLQAHPDSFVPRHIGPSEDETREMLELLGYDSLDALIDATIPETTGAANDVPESWM